MAHPQLLLVESNADDLDFLRTALTDKYEVSTAKNIAEATAQLVAMRFALIVCSQQLLDGTGVDFLRDCKAKHSEMQRVLWAPFTDIPQLLQRNAKEAAHVVIPKRGSREALRVTVARLLGEMEPKASPEAAVAEPPQKAPKSWSLAHQLLRWTISGIANTPGRVVRPLPTKAENLQLQFVVNEDDEAFCQFRAALAEAWGAPFKARDQSTTWRMRRHPVVSLFGDLARAQELYVNEVEPGLAIYLAILPWLREESGARHSRATVLLGICAKHFQPRYRDAIVELHSNSIDELSHLTLRQTFPLPAEGVAYVHDYDMVVTKDYGGPDRRERETSFANRFAFFGRRRHVAGGLHGELFVDRLNVWALRLLGCYVFLSLIDTACTYAFVGAGKLHELNPLLRPLIMSRPWLFVVIKNVLSLSTFLVVARFHLLRVGKILLPAIVAMYLALDIYWIWVLAFVRR